MGNVIGHNQRRRLQKIMNLPDVLRNGHVFRQRMATMGTHFGIMMVDPVRCLRPSQRLPCMTLLTARLFP